MELIRSVPHGTPAALTKYSSEVQTQRSLLMICDNVSIWGASGAALGELLGSWGDSGSALGGSGGTLGELWDAPPI